MFILNKLNYLRKAEAPSTLIRFRLKTHAFVCVFADRHTIVDRDMVWKLGKLQSDYNELRFDVGTVLAVHKSFVFRLLIFKQRG